MTRIFPPYTYGEAPRARCYWPDTVSLPVWPDAEGELRAEVAVIGGGLTGLSTALHLARDGVDVVLLEAETPGWGATGRNGGFCCLGGAALPDGLMRRRFGEEARRDWRQTEQHAVGFVRDLIRREGILADVHSEGETVMALSARGFEGLRGRAAQIEADLGVTGAIIPRAALAEHGLNGPFEGALTVPVGFALNPLKYALGLARAAREAGARLFAQSPVTGITAGDGFELRTARAVVRSKRLVVATNGYSSDDLAGWLRGRYVPAQSNILVTRPLTDDEIAAQGWTSAQMAYDERFFLHYFRLMPDRRFLFGMRGGLLSSDASDAAMERLMRRHFEAMFPAWAHVTTPYFWTGLLSLSRDLTPYVGPVPEWPGAFSALSYHGNGVAMGSYAGALLADLVQGRAPAGPYGAVLRQTPGRFPLGRWRRATLWPAYALARLRGE